MQPRDVAQSSIWQNKPADGSKPAGCDGDNTNPLVGQSKLRSDEHISIPCLTKKVATLASVSLSRTSSG
jgi:hypothetical protein